MRKPEVLAPVGDFSVLHAALQAGADAVYFGLAEGFNARARAQNFTIDRLPETVKIIHDAGAKAYITLNTLVFEDELKRVKELLLKIQDSGTDALIMQDLGAVRLAKRFAPAVHIHASTQMTLSDAWSVKMAKEWGIKRAVLARELSAGEIADISDEAQCDLEVFALGALCVSFSGQCLASLTWGGRSANRGQCAQPCRLPFRYASAEHGKKLDFSSGDFRVSAPAHFMSPCDLAGFEQIADLIKANTASLKIEGRLKGENYVYLAVKTMREWVDAHFDDLGNFKEPSADQVLRLRNNLSDLTITYSRGFTPGFLSSYNHQSFIQSGYPKHRGQLLGTVKSKNGRTIEVSLLSELAKDGKAAEYREKFRELKASPAIPQKGTGVLFLSPSAEKNRSEEVQGGPIFDCQKRREGIKLTFGHMGPDLSKVEIGDLIYVSSSPQTSKRVENALNTPRLGRTALHISAEAKLGHKLTIKAETENSQITVQSSAVLSEAQKNQLTPEIVKEKLAELSGTPFHLSTFKCSAFEDGLFLPLSELKPMRRTLISLLEQDLHKLQEAKKKLKPSFISLPKAEETEIKYKRSGLTALCRSAEQVRAAVKSGIKQIEIEAFKPDSLSPMLEILAEHKEISKTLVLPRIQKNGEERIIDKYLKLNPDSLLIRSLGSLSCLLNLKKEGCRIPDLHGDFSLNITNSLTADMFLHLGLATITLSDDLSSESALSLAKSLKSLSDKYPDMLAPVSRTIFTVYRQMPTFHSQHCLYASLLSKGTDKTNCGRPCMKNDLYLTDRRQFAHAVKADYLCRNTVFNQTPIQRHALAADLMKQGISNFRAEFLNENYSQTLKTLNFLQSIIDEAEGRIND